MIKNEMYKQWKKIKDLPESIKLDLNEMNKQDDIIEDAFNGFLSFGTAGMRGLMGAGTNRINIFTIRQATEGLSNYMDTLDEETKKRGVAISFDSRYNSKEFAYEAARVLGHHNIPSYVFDGIRPTPELSFAVRHLNAFAGIMITASHNPKQYNGFKIYGEDGGQMPPKASDMITSFVRKASDLFAIQAMPIRDLRKNSLIKIIGEDVDEAYLKEAKSVNINHTLIKKAGKNLKFVYTPLHGTGKVLARRALQDAGFMNYSIVAEQTISDPEFPTVKFPNPEFPEAFNLSIKLGNKVSADILIATDPDADRLGAAVRQPDGSYELMSGNQIAVVLMNYILKAKQDNDELPENGVIVKSIVSTELASKIAESYDIKTINVLTGFKFIAEQIKHFESNHNHTFLFGFEESFGYLIKPFVRDKDAIQSTMLLAEVAAYYKEKGKTVYDGLQDIYKKYGFYEEKTISKVFNGSDGKKQMTKIMEKLRNTNLDTFGNQKVVSTEDFQESVKTSQNGQQTKIDLPKSNVLKYWLSDGTWLAVRPSGTEPKIKFYVGTNASNKDTALEKLNNFEEYVHKLVEKLL
ncbi:phosphoglucomutase phosphomannomutase alpha beta alpha domain I [Apilactobacillus ozensis DSM 23829 = JCM 17196]|uniref:Phosphoglucomutase n=1 Tax=Apilactobacillus ozensis DSM 23829 = JCM 17196 TaxID=1423781 RepID=A0A0R2B1D8_9LACO|nr:phospho-sugar mutase [Apilactobacillus ozensis]KRM69929.1 phosphoglucomutase phosphomannomutase alpha beta alpha domain I [Apilactobacillus ozensis DSM 23829 = JCM 17196]